MEYNFKSKNVNTSFHAFGQIEGQKENIIEGLSIYNILCDFYEKEDAKNMIKEIENGNPNKFADLISYMYDNLKIEDCFPSGNVYYLEDLNMYFDVYINGKEITTMTIQICDYPKLKKKIYKASVY